MCRPGLKLPEVAQEAALVVRRLSAADVTDYRALRLQGLRDHPEAFGADADDESAWPISNWLARLDLGATFGAFKDGVLVGTAALAVMPGRKQCHRGKLVGMYVAPGGRGAGAGRRLVEAVLELAACQQVEIVELNVSAGNASAMALYLACGFRPYAVEPDAIRVDGRPIDDVLMRRPVPASAGQ
jgi:ribosomal protein S18 acetylase RimI-like enzyme